MRLRNFGMGMLVLIAVPVLLAASSGPLLPTIKDNGEDTHVSMRIPGFLIRLGSRFIPDEDAEAKEAMRHIRGVRFEVREGAYYPTDAVEQLALEAARHARNGYSPLMNIQSSDEQVHIAARLDRKDRIRHLAVVIADGESFVNIQLRTKIDPTELGAMLKAAGVDTHGIGGQETAASGFDIESGHKDSVDWAESAGEAVEAMEAGGAEMPSAEG